MFSVLEDLLPIDKYVDHSSGILVWRLERGMVLNFGRVEDDDVGEISWFQQTPSIQFQVRSWKRR